MSYITLKKNDPSFETYIQGELPNNKLSIAVKSLNVGSQREEVTFEVREKSEQDKLSLIQFFFLTLRPKSLFLILLPVFLISSQSSAVDLSAESLLIVILGLIFGFSGVTLLADARDYVTGWDRIKDSENSLLGLGFLSLKKVNKIIIIYFILSLLLLFLLMVKFYSYQILLISGVTLFLIALWGLQPFNFKYKIFGEFVIFLIFGPLLFLSLDYFFNKKIYLDNVLLSVVFGINAVCLFLSRQFLYLMELSRSKFKTTLVVFGFNKSRFYLLFLLQFSLILSVYYEFVFHGKEWGVVFLINFIFSFFLAFYYLKQLKSPLGRGVVDYNKTIRQIILVTHLLFVLQWTWYFAWGIE